MPGHGAKARRQVKRAMRFADEAEQRTLEADKHAKALKREFSEMSALRPTYVKRTIKHISWAKQIVYTEFMGETLRIVRWVPIIDSTEEVLGISVGLSKRKAHDMLTLAKPDHRKVRQKMPQMRRHTDVAAQSTRLYMRLEQPLERPLSSMSDMLPPKTYPKANWGQKVERFALEHGAMVALRSKVLP